MTYQNLDTLHWCLPRPSESKYPGSFPRYFEGRLWRLLGYPKLVLQPFGGRAEIGVRCDLKAEVEPDVICDAHDLPFEDDAFDLVLLDPPYSDDEARTIYGTPALKPSVFTAEAVRVTRPGGFVVVYGKREPVRPKGTNSVLRVVVSIRSNHTPRVAKVFVKKAAHMPHADTA